MGFWEEIRGRRVRSVAVFGLAKNAGKTVALNRLIQGADEDGVVLGLTSIGRDGETWDVLTHRRKPAIRAAAGTLLATAEECLDAGTARLEVVDRGAGIATPLGPVLLVRVVSPGTVEVAGPSRAESLVRIVRRLGDLGAELVLVDGAVDRQSLASPAVTGACVMATGAAVDESMDRVVEVTRDRVHQLTLPGAPEEHRKAWQRGALRVQVDGEWVPVPVSEAFRGQSRIRELTGGEETVVLVGGALTDPLLQDLLGKGALVVVRDSTCLLVNEGLFRRFEREGGRVRVVEPLRLAAVTVNPTSPEGWAFDPESFFEAVRAAVPDVPVYDVVAGYGPAGTVGKEA